MSTILVEQSPASIPQALNLSYLSYIKFHKNKLACVRSLKTKAEQLARYNCQLTDITKLNACFDQIIEKLKNCQDKSPCDIIGCPKCSNRRKQEIALAAAQNAIKDALYFSTNTYSLSIVSPDWSCDCLDLNNKVTLIRTFIYELFSKFNHYGFNASLDISFNKRQNAKNLLPHIHGTFKATESQIQELSAIVQNTYSTDQYDIYITKISSFEKNNSNPRFNDVFKWCLYQSKLETLEKFNKDTRQEIQLNIHQPIHWTGGSKQINPYSLSKIINDVDHCQEILPQSLADFIDEFRTLYRINYKLKTNERVFELIKSFVKSKANENFIPIDDFVYLMNVNSTNLSVIKGMFIFMATVWLHYSKQNLPKSHHKNIKRWDNLIKKIGVFWPTINDDQNTPRGLTRFFSLWRNLFC